jgi:hypothetical protein
MVEVMRAFAFALVLLASVACTGGTTDMPPPDMPSRFSADVATRHGDIVRLEIVPIPEGPPGPMFARGALPSRDGRLVLPLRDVREYIPSALPASLDQGPDCEGGGNLVVTFHDEYELAYGPCRRPPAIDHLWAGMIYVFSDGACAPRCGPDGALGP